MIASYDDLKASVARWLRRTDLTDDIPTFIALAEAQLNRRLRTSAMTARATAVVTDEYSAVPAGFAGVRTFDLATSPVQKLQGLTPDQMTEERARCGSGTGKPRWYSVVGAEFRYLPVPDETYTVELTYWTTLEALSDSNPSNWLLATHPDAYLYGALTASAPFLKDDGRVSVWGALFVQAIEDINAADEWRNAGAQPARRARSLG